MKPANGSSDPPPTFRQTRRNRNISIEGMKGRNCVAKVKQALDGLKEIDVESVTVGHAAIRSATIPEARAACAAIKRAGFEPRKAPKAA